MRRGPPRPPRLPIGTRRLWLRLPRVSDAPAIAAVCRQWRVSRGIPPMPHPYRLEHATTFVRDVRARHRRGASFVVALVRRESGQLVGMMELSHIDLEHRNAELGYWLDPSAWGQGLATEAGERVCRLGFDELGLHRIWAGVLAFNDASRRVLRRLGFRPEGRQREAYRRAGRWVDALRFARLSTDPRPAARRAAR